MRDVRKMIANLDRKIERQKEDLDKELAMVAEKAQGDRSTSYYLSDVERAVREANDTLARIKELELQKHVLQVALDED